MIVNIPVVGNTVHNLDGSQVFFANNTDNNGVKVGLFDDLQVYDHALSNTEVQALAAVPEPSSAALLGLGGIALILRRRK